MGILLKIIWNLLAVFGLLSLVALIFGFWWINNNLPGLFSFQEQTQEFDHPLLDEQQEETLSSLGVDISVLPNQISPEMESCFVDVLGQARVDAIKNGDSVTATDYLKARGCI